MIEVFIAVMDYSTGTIYTCSEFFNPDYTDEDVYNYLVDVHGYRDSTSYYMFSNEPITIEQR